MTNHNEVQNVPSDAALEHVKQQAAIWKEEARTNQAIVNAVAEVLGMNTWDDLARAVRTIKTAGSHVGVIEAWKALDDLAIDHRLMDMSLADAIGAAVKQAEQKCATAAPLTVSLSPDPRGVHVAVHQGSECVHSEAMALPVAIGQSVPADKASLVGHAFKLAAQLNNGSDAAEIELRHTIRLLAASPTPPAGEGQEPVAWMHDQPGRVDVIHAAVKKVLHESHEAAGYLNRPLDKSERYTIPLYTAEQVRAAVLADRGSDWLPLDSAPKDGTRVILAWGGKAINGFYLDNSSTDHPWQGWRTESMVPRPSGQPTHWQPFPVTPTDTQRAKETT